MASNIAFIIGNGLDLSLGLKTKYKDFYKHVQSKNAKTQNKIYQAIKESPETWADFESQLGKYSYKIEKVSEDDKVIESKNLHEDLEEIRDDLAEYLAMQENSIENLPDKFGFSITPDGFFEELTLGQREIVQSYIVGGPINIDFVTLNYTSTLEKILDGTILRGNLGFDFKAPLHVHGDLSQDLTFGVSDESQLYAGMPTQEKEDLIKPLLINSMNDGRISRFRNVVNRSSLLVFFGTSIGATDKYLWEYIISWLNASADRRIVVHVHDSSYTDNVRRSSRRHKQFVDNVQNRLLGHSSIDDSLKEKLKKQIFVIHNTKKLFIPINSQKTR